MSTRRAKPLFRARTAVHCAVPSAIAARSIRFWSPSTKRLPLAPLLSGDDLVIVQGAGNIGKIARKLAEIQLQPALNTEARHG